MRLTRKKPPAIAHACFMRDENDMAGPGKRSLRKLWWQVHKWLALTLMALLIPLCLSGAVLAWDDAIDHALNPQRYAVSGRAILSPSAYTSAATGAAGKNFRVTMLRYPDGDDPVTASASIVPDPARRSAEPSLRATIWLDPPTARILDVRQGDTGLVRIAHNFHGSLFIEGGTGRALVGGLGVAMVLLAVAGLWLWWPPIGSWLTGLRWRRGDRRLDISLHHTVGFWMALPLLLQAFTGVWIAWPRMIEMAGIGSGPPGGGMHPPIAAAPPLLSPDRALEAAWAIAHGRPKSITWPTAKTNDWKVVFDTPKGPAGVTIDDKTGAAGPAVDHNDLAMVMRHIHDGTAIGWGWRLLMLLWAFAPLLLGLTGLTMWLRNRRWRAKMNRRGRNGSVKVAAVQETVAAE